MYTTPTDIRVKKMLPTSSVQSFSVLGNGTASITRQNNGMGKNTHIIWLYGEGKGILESNV